MSAGQKTPFSVSMNNFVKQKVGDNQNIQGLILPCTVIAVEGSMVTVNFELLPSEFTFPQVTCPIAEPQYIRMPIQVGDTGVCISASTRLGGISGLGKGKAPLSNPSNLGGLIFVPIGNTNWFSVNPDILFMYGTGGVELTTINRDCSLILNSSGITINLNGGNLNINNGNVTIQDNLTVQGTITGEDGFNISGGGGGTVNITGTIFNNGKNIGSTHEHSGVQTGGSNTGAPI